MNRVDYLRRRNSNVCSDVPWPALINGWDGILEVKFLNLEVIWKGFIINLICLFIHIFEMFKLINIYDLLFKV